MKNIKKERKLVFWDILCSERYNLAYNIELNTEVQIVQYEITHFLK